jgi:hypothetical protein
MVYGHYLNKTLLNDKSGAAQSKHRQTKLERPNTKGRLTHRGACLPFVIVITI